MPTNSAKENHDITKEKLLNATKSVLISNAIAIPSSRLFNQFCIQPNTATRIVLNRFFQEIRSGQIKHQYAGGMARIMSKQIVTTGNAFVPKDLTEEHPLLTSFAVGLACSPFSNFFKMAQLNKCKPTPESISYPNFARKFSESETRKVYKLNTGIFALNESLRSMTCFGISAWIQNIMSKNKKEMTLGDHALTIACAGIVSASVETLFGGPGEILTAAQANLKKSETKTEFSLKYIQNFVKTNNMIHRAYLTRAMSTLFIKNVLCNTVLSGYHYKSRTQEEEQVENTHQPRA